MSHNLLFQKGDFVRLTDYGIRTLGQTQVFEAIGWDGLSPVKIDAIDKIDGLPCAIIRWGDRDDDEADDAEMSISFDWLEAVPAPSQVN